MLITLITAVALSSTQPAGSPVEKLEIRSCPSKLLHTAPLAPGTRFQSLVVPDLAIINHGGSSLHIEDVTFELMNKGESIDSRRLAGETLAEAVRAGAAAQAQVEFIPFQYCDGKLLERSKSLSSEPKLAPQTAVLVANQTFGWKGARDELKITMRASSAGETEIARFSIPISASGAATPLRFPLNGRWAVVVAATPHGGHRWVVPEAFAIDVAAYGKDNKSYRGTGRRFSDYYAYGAPVLAAADGVVVEVVGDQSETNEILRRASESLAAYGERMSDLQMRLLKAGDRALGGNSVIIDHLDGEFSLYAHLQPGSIPVKVGERVKAGTRIGRLGASGNSTEPHLHFQVCDAPSALHCAGIPFAFANVELPYADGPRALQAGDIVVTH